MENLKTKIKTFKLIIAIVTLIVLVNYQIENVYYSYIIEGGEGSIEVASVSFLLMLFIYGYISSEIALMFFNFKYGELLYLILTFVQPWLVVFVIYPKYFNEYSNNVKQEMLEDSHVRIGYVYSVRQPIEKDYSEVYLGIDKSYKSLHYISKEERIKVGDTLLLRVSDEYHRVCEVLKWHPTHEEIERYKTPRKFKSFDSRKRKIIEEEVPDKVEGKEVVPSISVELDGVEQELQLEEHEHDEGVESADIVDIADISNELEDESIELEEFEYEFQPEKRNKLKKIVLLTLD